VKKVLAVIIVVLLVAYYIVRPPLTLSSGTLINGVNTQGLVWCFNPVWVYLRGVPYTLGDVGHRFNICMENGIVSGILLPQWENSTAIE